MRQGAVQGLIRRRGTIVLWEHAIPADGDDVGRDARNVKLTAFGPRTTASPSGETYGRKYRVRALIKARVNTLRGMAFGPVDSRNLQIDLAAPFAPEPDQGIITPGQRDLEDWNAGRFTVYPITDPDEADEIALIGRDRFTISGQRYIVKAAAVPLQDRNITFAYRIMLALDPFSTPTLEIR